VRLLQALGRAADDKGPMILLENDSGSGSHMGSSLTDIAELINNLGSTRVGSCFDTCHAFASGYNLATQDGITKTLHEIKKTIGFNRLKLIHLNDSVGGLGFGIDHHDHIGLGRIGEDGFHRILTSQLAKRPMIMETPVDDRRSDTENMDKVRELARVNK
jgi:deoxyribonuclease-4